MNTRVPHAGSAPGWYTGSPDDKRPRWWNGREWTDTYLDSLESLWLRGSGGPQAEKAAASPAVDSSSEIEEAVPNEIAADPAEQAEPPPDSLELSDPPTDSQEQQQPHVDDITDDAEPAAAAESPPDPPEEAEPPVEDDVQSSIDDETGSYDEHHPVRDPILDRRRIPRAEDHTAPPALYTQSVQTLSSQARSSANRAYVAVAYRPVSSKNGPAKASVFVALAGLIVGCLVPWWYAAGSPVIAQALLIDTVALLAIALILAIIGVILALRRPTTKARPVISLILSLVLAGGAVALYAFNALTPPPFDAADVESTVEAWYLSDSGASVTVICPHEVPTVDGAVFLCSAQLESGMIDAVQVHVQGGSFTWRTVTP